MTERELMLSFLTKIFAKTDDELAPLIYQKVDDKDELKADALDQLVGLDTARITRLKKTATTDLFDNGHRKGTKEAMENFEKEFKSQTGIQSDKTGLDLILEWGEGLKKTDFPEDKLKTHPTFISAERAWQDRYNKDLTQVRTEFETFKTQVEGERKFSGIKSKAREHFLGLNPVLSEDPAKAERQVNTFLNGLQRYEYPEQEGITLITQNGHRIEDEHGNPIPFDKFIRSEAEQLFDFRTQGDKGQAGNKYVPGTTVAAPQNEEDYRKMVDSETDPKKLVAIQDAWIKSQGKKPPVL